MFSSHFYGLGSHLRVEEKVSGGGGASHYNTQPPSALLWPVPFLQCAGGTKDGKFATRLRKLPTGSRMTEDFSGEEKKAALGKL